MPIFNGLYTTQADGPGILPAILTQNGPTMPVEIHVPDQLAQLLQQQGLPVPLPQVGVALIDTGASKSGAHAPAMTALGVNPVGQMNLGTAGGPVPTSLYPARFVLAAGAASPLTVNFSSVIGVDLSDQTIGGQNLIALIGRDILSNGILIYNGNLGVYSIALG